MRDMPRAQTRYPMNLAETASIFFETVVGDRLVEMAATPEEKLEYAWYDAESAAAFLLNIPTRFDFECRMHEARDRGETLTPTLLREMMAEAWQVFLPCTSCRLRTRDQWQLIDLTALASCASGPLRRHLGAGRRYVLGIQVTLPHDRS
jgi:hypothetical protein